MKRKIFSVLFALVLLLSFSVVTAVPAMAAVLTVDTGSPNTPPNYHTIQAAITAASPGDTINVAAGTYNEDLTIPATKSNLELAGATGATIKGVSLSQWGVTTIPNIEILADGVSIHGFTIQGPDPSGTLFAAGMIIGAQDVEIYDNAFEVNNANDTSALDDICQGIVTYNKLAKPGVDVSGLSIHDNTFTHRGTGIYGYEGIYINRDVGTGAITIVDNTFTGDILRGITVERSKALICGNTVIDTGGGAWTGVLVMDIGGFYGTGCEAQDSVSVTSNFIEGFSSGIKLGPSDQSQVLTNVNIIGNDVQNCTVGILVRSSANGVIVNFNNITGNTSYGVQNTDDVNDLDATKNWWGHASGPSGENGRVTKKGKVIGKGDAVSNYVDWDPWLPQPVGHTKHDPVPPGLKFK